MSYGHELIIDLKECDVSTFTRESLTRFFVSLCDKIEMQRGDLHFWDYEGDPEGYKNAPDHLKGISAVQFVMTSNITLHTLDVLGMVFINVFSCEHFNGPKVVEFCAEWFKGDVEDSGFFPRMHGYSHPGPKICASCKKTIEDDQWYTFSSVVAGEISPVCGDCLSELHKPLKKDYGRS